MDAIKYVFDTEGISDTQFDFLIDIECVELVKVTCVNNQVKVDMEVSGVFDGDDLSVFHDYFKNWSVIFGFECGVPVRNIRKSGYSLPRRDGTRNQVIAVGPLSYKIPKDDVLPGEEEANNILCLANSTTEELTMYYHQFAFANAEVDAISRYSFLYNLLLQISGDNQKKVDQVILAVDPNCEQSTSPNNNKPETLYTRLRNELAHKREGVRYTETKNSIEEKVDDLSLITKEIIRNQ